MKKRILAFLCILTLSVGSMSPNYTAYAANNAGEMNEGISGVESQESVDGQEGIDTGETVIPEDISESEKPEDEQPSDNMDENIETPETAEEQPQPSLETESDAIAEQPESLPLQPETDNAEPGETNVPANAEPGLENEISVEGENGFGSLMADVFMEEITEQQENSGYNVFAIEIDGNAAKVSYESLENATLVVGIYDEVGGQMLASGATEVSPEETTTVVEIETESMPQYFYVRGFLVETATYRPLCTVYESPMYTKEMQDFLAKTTADFDADKVLNLDEDTTNNFAVFSDGVVQIPENSGYNEVVTADEANNTYVISNADENITALQPGDVFSYHYGENDVLIVKVAAINLDGTTATIFGEETSLEEVFDYVKIDAQGGSADAVVDTSTCAEGVTYEGLVEYAEEDMPQTYADIGGSASKAFKLSFDKEFGGIEDINVKLSGGLEMKLTFSAKVYLTLDKQYVELKLDYGAKIYASVTGKAKAEIPLITVGIMFTGIIVEMTPSVVLDAKANISLEGNLSGTIGFRAQVGKGVTNLTTVPKFKPSVKIEGSIFYGLSLEPRINILSEKVASASLKGKVGVEISASFKDPLKLEEDRKHTCAECITGEVDGKFSLTAGLKLVNKWNFNLTILERSFKIFDFYYSLDRDEFGLSTCPYYVYQVKVTVLDSLFHPLEGATVNGTLLDREYVTDKDGKTELWLPKGIYGMVFRKGGLQPYSLTTKVVNKGLNLYVWLSQKDEQGGSSGSGGEGDGGGSGDGEDAEKKKVVQVSLGYSYSAAITEEGDLYLWGYNKDGQLGNGTNENSNEPIKVMSNVKEVCLGEYHSAAITEEGDLYLWGRNFNGYGQLGNGTNGDSNVPIKIMSNVKKVSLGEYHSAAITEEGDLYLWGLNECGQLGNGTNKNSIIPIKIMSNVKEVCLGNFHSAMITEEGDLYLWGLNEYGQLGNGTNKDGNEPIKIMSNVKEVSLGRDYSAAITEEGDLYLWGYNWHGQLGNGTNEDSNVPIRIMSNVKEVSLGETHSAAIMEEDLYSWGWLNNKPYSNVPTKIMDNVKEVCLGAAHGAAITEKGELYLWGYNWHGQLGNGTNEDSNVPIKITIPSVNKSVNESALSIQTESLSEGNIEQIAQNADVAASEMPVGFSGRQQNWNGGYFNDLIPNEIYNYYVLRSKTADQPFASGNLLYIGQATSDESGILNVAFTMQEAYSDADIFAVPMHLIDISNADVTVSDLICNGELQYVPVKVSCQGIELAAGEDYYIEGDYGVTEAGDYTLTINGTGLYTGSRTVTYKVLPAVTQYQISGTVKSYGNTQDDTVIRLLQGTDEVSSTKAANGIYQLNEVPGGLYTLEVSKSNHVTRRYEITVSDMAVGQDAEIWLIGDANGDGRVNAKDKKILYNHIEGSNLLADYAFLVGDVNSDGRINAKDKKMIYNHTEGTVSLWN